MATINMYKEFFVPINLILCVVLCKCFCLKHSECSSSIVVGFTKISFKWINRFVAY